MNILFVSQNYFPFTGGVEAHVRQVGQELSKQHQVRIAAVRFAISRTPRRLSVLEDNLLVPRFESSRDGNVAVEALSPTIPDRLRMLPLIVRALPLVPRYAYHGLNRFGYRFYRNVFLPKLRKWVQGADIVHCMAFGPLGWAAREATAERGIPFVCTPFVHPHQWGDGDDDIAYYKRAQAIVALVDTDRQYLISLGLSPDRMHVIGVSPELPPTSDPVNFRRRHGLNTAPVVLYVGRMMQKKGASAVLAAAPIVWQNNPEVRFVFIGPASPAEATQFANCDPRVKYLGKVSTQEKADALAACDVFCMPSLSEILPTVYLEAWSNGKPVIGGMAPGLPELVEGADAGFASSQDPHALGSTLGKLLGDPALRARLGANGKSLVEKKYSVPAVTHALLEMYHQVIDERSALAANESSIRQIPAAAT